MRQAIAVLLIGVGVSSAAPALDLSPDEQAVWQMEEQYWRDVQSGDVATALYAAEYVTDYGDGTKSGAGIWRKFTHTWIKRDGRWQIITGMCAAQEPIKTPRG